MTAGSGGLGGGSTRTILVVDVDGTLTDNHVTVDADGRELLRFSKLDGWRLPAWGAMGNYVCWVTCDPSEREFSGPASARAKKLGVALNPCADGAEKAEVVRALKAEGWRVVYIGNAPDDVEAMREADEAWCPRDGMPDGLPGLVSPSTAAPLGDGKFLQFTNRKGGHGVLHEVLGYLMEGAK